MFDFDNQNVNYIIVTWILRWKGGAENATKCNDKYFSGQHDAGAEPPLVFCLSIHYNWLGTALAKFWLGKRQQRSEIETTISVIRTAQFSLWHWRLGRQTRPGVGDAGSWWVTLYCLQTVLATWPLLPCLGHVGTLALARIGGSWVTDGIWKSSSVKWTGMLLCWLGQQVD